MSNNWFEQHLRSVQKRYGIASGIFALCFAQYFLQSLEQKQPLLITIVMGYLLVRIIGLGWRYLSNQSLIQEFINRVPENERKTKRCKKIFEYIMKHERGLWIGWSNALGYALVLTTMPVIPVTLMAGFLIYALWHYYKLQEMQEFMVRIEIHGWMKLGSLTHDPLLQEIDPLPLRRTSAAFFVYKKSPKARRATGDFFEPAYAASSVFSSGVSSPPR